MSCREAALFLGSLPFIFLYFLFLRVTPNLPGGDFVNMYYGSHLARHVPDFLPILMNPESYLAYLREYLGAGFPPHNWSYSPLMLLIAWPLSLFDYYTALALWAAIGIAWYYVEARHYLKQPQSAWLLLLCPTMLAAYGQNGFLTAALLLGAWRRRDTAPVQAGLMIALLTIKPHLYLLLPVALLFTRAWKTIAATIGWIAALFLLTVWAFGLEAWQLYFTQIASYQVTVLESWQGIMRLMMPSLFNATFMLSGSIKLAYALQGAMAVIVLIFYLLQMRRHPSRRNDLEFTILASFLLTPYLFVYDLMVLMPFLLNRLLAPEADTSRLATKLLYFIPGLWLVVAMQFFPPTLSLFCLGLWVMYLYYYFTQGKRLAQTAKVSSRNRTRRSR